MKCPICKKELKKAKIREEQFGVFLGEYEGLLCAGCKESFFDAETTRKIVEKAKEKGIFGIEGRTKIAQSGNSLAVRIPKKIAELLNLKAGKEVRVHPVGDKIVIES